MSTYSKVKQTLINLEGAKATMDIYAKLAQEESIRKNFERHAQKLEVVIKLLKERVQTMEREEPEYKGI